MAVDMTWVDQVKREHYATPIIQIDGIPLEIPVPRRGARNTWQGLVSDDILPDYPQADAPEKIPFDILNRLTEEGKAERSLSAALADGTDFAPLRPLFMFATQGTAQIPVAFHVLAVKAPERPVPNNAFGYRTFLLLMRDHEGRIDEDLVRRLIEHFRLPTEELDLAQRAVLEALQPGWSPESSFRLSITDERRILPFLPRAGELLRRDLATLLDTRLTRADFFRYANQLLAIHFGLYQPRLAYHINPAVEMLLQELADPGSVSAQAVERIERGQDDAHSFFARLQVQAPEGATRRRMSMDMPACKSFADMKKRLAALHFQLILLNRLRHVLETFLVHAGHDPDSATAQSRRPSQMVQRMQEDPAFRRFLERATEALAVRFALEQLEEHIGADMLEGLARAPSGLHALRDLYQHYNLQSASKSRSTRAYKTGEQVVRRLLSMGENGLLQGRKKLGAYFEIGGGLLPLLLITTVRQDEEKIQVGELWKRLGDYGLHLDRDEQERLLGRLKAMGLYERFSDAGEASYVRGLITAEVS